MSQLERAKMEFRACMLGDVGAIVDFAYSETESKLNSERIASIIAENPSCIALSHGEVVGFSYTKPFAPDVLEILNILVRSRYQSCGTGSQILLFIQQRALERKFAALIAVNSLLYKSRAKSGFASRFYLKNGFSEVCATENTKILVKCFTTY
jgi:N-acetylglutamate synthase-like GNAT family acetyltransferase